METVHAFGIPFEVNDENGDLIFPNGIEPEDIKEKRIPEIKQLLFDHSNLPDKRAYKFYANIFTPKYKEVFQKYGYTNGITAIAPERVNGECLKNSGHYHMTHQNETVPYMECYEVLKGKAAFLLQKSTRISDDKPLVIEDCVVVIMEEKDKLVVPPHYAHCAVNIGEGPMLFGNLAAPCPLNYEAIQHHHGFFTYVLDISGERVFVQNQAYENLPKIRVIRAKESSKHGVTRALSLNESFIQSPEKFVYLNNPERYIEEIETLLEG